MSCFFNWRHGARDVALRGGLIASLTVLTLTLTLTGCDKSPSKPRQAASVKILPDTPPPPPPPKVEEKKPEPQKEDKPQQQLNQPKTEAPPQPQALKTDEAAGDGQGGGLQSGGVNQDYKEGTPGGGSGGEQLANRFAFNAYASAATRELNDFLAKDKDLKQRNYRLKINVWLDANGRAERFELVGSTGDASTDDALRAALNRFPGTRTPVPDKLPQPLRLLISNRMLG